MKTILIFGTFDVIHPGHEFFLKQVRKRGERVVASVARDAFVQTTKGRKPVHDEEERLKQILETGFVDEASLSDEIAGTYTVIRRLSPDLICLGHDQFDLKKNLQQWLEQNGLDISIAVIEPYKPHVFKSSRLNRVKNDNQ